MKLYTHIQTHNYFILVVKFCMGVARWLSSAPLCLFDFEHTFRYSESHETWQYDGHL